MSTERPAAGFGSIVAFVEELSRAGVHHVCVAPGSRSTPLALALAEHPDIRVWMHVDERSTGYFALGMAKALNQVVGVLCTSGTAAANLLPAVVEAYSSATPLLLMTADRPAELHDVGATQTIDQHHLFGRFAKWFVNADLGAESPVLLRYARSLAGRAAATARAVPAGPVHLNFPFREPLTPGPADLRVPGGADSEAGFNTTARAGSNTSSDTEIQPGSALNQPWVRIHDEPPSLSPASLQNVADALLAARRPMFVCGPQPDVRLAVPLAQLASALKAPLLADPLSQLRWGPHERSAIMDRYDTFLRHEGTAARLAPDLIVRFGSTPTSKTLLEFMERHAEAGMFIVDPARWPDPTLMSAAILHADPARLSESLLGLVQHSRTATDSHWLASWTQANSTTDKALRCHSQSLSENFDLS